VNELIPDENEKQALWEYTLELCRVYESEIKAPAVALHNEKYLSGNRIDQIVRAALGRPTGEANI
jgi:hypothetical protein